MGDRLKGRNALVTGGGGGIGREIALALAAEGANVVINDYGVKVDGTSPTAMPAEKVAEEIRKMGGRAATNFGNVASFKDAEKMVKEVVDNFGRIDILCNIAGILRDRMVFNMSEEEWDGVINVHLKGSFNTIRHATPLMRQQRYGRIINVTSDAWRGTVGHCNYGAAKGGLTSLTYAIARELGRYGVTCNAICPMAGTRMTLSPETIAGFQQRLKAGLISQAQYDAFISIPGPEYIPPIVVYLVREASANINGQIFGCEGGRVSIFPEPVLSRSVYKTGKWTLDELEKIVPISLLQGYVNPAPPQPAEEKK